MEAELRDSTNFDDRSDYSVALMYLGRYKDAVNLLEGLEKEQPGRYAIAANLGTALELSGNNKEALKWISEGMRRNSDSHVGTEWLHAKILQVKIASEADTNYLKEHRVIEVHPENIGDQITIDGHVFSMKEVSDAMEYQLEERLKFVKPPDPVVAGLIFDYASIEAATGTLESAEKLLQMAVEYGYPSEKVQPLIKSYDKKIAWRKTKQYGTYTLIGCVAIGVLAVLYKRGIFVISSRDLKR